MRVVQTIADLIQSAGAMTRYRDAHDSERLSATMRATASVAFPSLHSNLPHFLHFAVLLPGLFWLWRRSRRWTL
jgi:hypothetical protein